MAYQGKFTRIPRERGTSRKARGPRLSGVIFYTLFFLCILVFYTGLYFALGTLELWLRDYEAAQPVHKSREIFETWFADPDWGKLYDLAGMEDTALEGREAFADGMAAWTNGRKPTCMETSAGLSGDKKYLVRLDGETVAAFTLEDRNREEAEKIPDWQLKAVELFPREQAPYFVEIDRGCTAYVNGVALKEEWIQRITTTRAEDYLPEGTGGKTRLTYQLSGLMARPQVRVTDQTGQDLAVSFRETTRTFTQQSAPEVLGEEERQRAIDAVKTYALYMIAEAGNRELAQYFRKDSKIYKTITASELDYVQDAASREFVDEQVTDYCRYTEDLFSVRVRLTLNLYRASGSVKENPISQSLFFEKQPSGSWLCTEMTAVDVTQIREQVRLTFREDDRVVASFFVSAQSRALTCPVLPGPQGKTFGGWATKQQEGGKTVMHRMFCPDDEGNVTLPEGTRLEPMTLYPLWEEGA